MTNDQNGPRRLYKSRRIRMIDGICGGIAEYFGVDVTIIRLLFVLLGFMGGTGLLVYIAAMIIMPANPDFSSVPEQNGRQGNGRRFWGIALILAGAAVLMVNLGWLAGYDWWSPSGTVILPIIMIGAGIFIVIGLRGRRQPAGDSPAAGTGDFAVRQEPARELRRSIRNRKLFGVCGGLGDYFSVDPTIVRLIAVVLVFASFGWALLVYIALGILMPEEKLSVQS